MSKQEHQLLPCPFCGGALTQLLDAAERALDFIVMEYDEDARNLVAQLDAAIAKATGGCGMSKYDDTAHQASLDLARRLGAAQAENKHLLTLLGTLVYWHDKGSIDESWWDEARAVIAKGEQS